MKTIYTILTILFASSLQLIAQTSFTNTQIISLPATTGDAPYAIATADIDADGFSDLVIGTQIGGSIFWYKNDGAGNFSLQTTITTALPSVSDIVLVDLNSDGAIDILTSSFSDDKVVWYANTPSNLGVFGSEQVIVTALDGAGDIDVGDINGDTFVDFVVAAYYNDKVVWFAGDGAGNFGTENSVDNGLVKPGSIDLKDADNDGDLDVIISTAVNLNNTPGLDTSRIEIRLNTLVQNASATFINDQFPVTTGKSYLFNVALHDIDDDAATDLDVLSTDLYNNLSWYKRDQGGMTYTETIIATSVINPASVGFYDLDLSNDGLKDIILSNGASGATDNDLVWFKNNGSGNYAAETVIDNTQNQAYKFIVEDIDNDADLDIVSIAYGDHTVKVFNNQRYVLHRDDVVFENLLIFPNPTSDKLVISYNDTRAIDITIFNLLGEPLLETRIQTQASIDVSHLSSGTYFIKVSNTNTSYKFIKK